jgi:hypothetical protein
VLKLQVRTPLAEGLPILCLDFDGVIHDYRQGWKGGQLYGHMTPGFYEWAEQAQKYFRLVIYSSRSKDVDGIELMAAWLGNEIGKPVVRQKDHGNPNTVVTVGGVLFEFAHQKPPAFLTIDDRAVQFKGTWGELDPRKLREFRPWMDAQR